jgi:hypothetical protein
VPLSAGGEGFDRAAKQGADRAVACKLLTTWVNRLGVHPGVVCGICTSTARTFHVPRCPQTCFLAMRLPHWQRTAQLPRDPFPLEGIGVTTGASEHQVGCPPGNAVPTRDIVAAFHTRGKTMQRVTVGALQQFAGSLGDALIGPIASFP